MKHIETLDEFNKLKSENSKLVVDFYTTWCGPCKKAGPIFEKLATKYPSVTFVKVDCDKGADISGHYGVQSIPTFISFLNGHLREKKSGFNEVALVGMIEKL